MYYFFRKKKTFDTPMNFDIKKKKYLNNIHD